MPRITVRFVESALRDPEENTVWYWEKGVPDVGERRISEIFLKIEALSDHPDISRIVPEFGQAFLHEFIHQQFRIVYRRDKGSIRVVRVWRSERLLRLSNSTNGT